MLNKKKFLTIARLQFLSEYLLKQTKESFSYTLKLRANK